MLRKVVGLTVRSENGRHYACAHYPSSTQEHGLWKCGCCRRGYIKPLPGFVCPACQATVDSAFVWKKANDSGEYKLAALLEAANAEEKPQPPEPVPAPPA